MPVREPTRTEPALLAWVVLTRGDRLRALDRALDSLTAPVTSEVVVVSNGGGPLPALAARPGVRVVEVPENVGIPAGRDLGLRACTSPLVGFLDDDAELVDAIPSIVGRFAADDRLAAVSLRIVDERGETARRHVPRFGRRGADRSGRVGTFLGGASVLRRDAYLAVGGYFGELRYGHEELELSWRLIDGGWHIVYLAEVEVRHPRTAVGRHAQGWRLTGRNRVLIARRSLPHPVDVVHAGSWLLLGVLRAPDRPARRAFVEGWLTGWRRPVARSPISWRSVWRLARVGRPPVV